MLKVVVFDGGFGGELFADRLEQELPIVDVTRVIDWRNASGLQKGVRHSRRITEAALRPYLGRVDLIVIANHFVTLTSLAYFRRVYPQQKFVGFNLPQAKKPMAKTSHKPKPYRTVVLTTHAVARTFKFQRYLLSKKRKATVICVDAWPGLIDDGELTNSQIEATLAKHKIRRTKAFTTEFVLACSQFSDIKPPLSKLLGSSQTVFTESFGDTLREVGRALGIRGRKCK